MLSGIGLGDAGLKGVEVFLFVPGFSGFSRITGTSNVSAFAGHYMANAV
jgi:hypothetical protein